MNDFVNQRDGVRVRSNATSSGEQMTSLGFLFCGALVHMYYQHLEACLNNTGPANEAFQQFKNSASLYLPLLLLFFYL